MRIRKEYVKVNIELAKLLKWIQKNKDEDMQKGYEMVLGILRVIGNSDFIKDIQKIRDRINLPSHLLNVDNDKIDSLLDWIGSHPSVPQQTLDKTIIKLCLKYGLSPLKYHEFVFGYLYRNEVVPYYPLWTGEVISTNETKKKARIEINYGNTRKPQAGYIRFFKDTTKNKLKKFIDENWNLIKDIKEELNNYPVTKFSKPTTFKLYLEIYLYYCLGYTDSEIELKISEIFNFSPDKKNIRKYVSEMKKLIKNSRDINYSLRGDAEYVIEQAQFELNRDKKIT